LVESAEQVTLGVFLSVQFLKRPNFDPFQVYIVLFQVLGKYANPRTGCFTADGM